MVWGVGQLATGPLLTLTIIVINSDTQSSLFTGSGGRERRDKLVYWREPFSQGAVVHHLGWWGWWDVGGRREGWWGGSGAPQLKTHCDLVAGRSYAQRKFKQGEEISRTCSSRYQHQSIKVAWNWCLFHMKPDAERCSSTGGYIPQLSALTWRENESS